MINWTKIKQNTGGTLFRAQVIGGWLVKEVQELPIQTPEVENSYNTFVTWRNQEGYNWTSSICFVSDPEHKWTID
jgi:hypothetical protein